MRNVVPGTVKFRFIRPSPNVLFLAPPGPKPTEPSGLSTIPAASPAPQRGRNKSFSSSTFIKWRKQSVKPIQWKFRSRQRSTDATSESSVATFSPFGLSSLFSYLSWIPSLLIGSLSSIDTTESSKEASIESEMLSNKSTHTERMQRRLASLSLKEIKVQGDGACQFRAVAAAMWDGDESRHPEIRSSVIDWLRDHEQTPIDASGTPISAFLDTATHASWVDYLSYQRNPFTWGDQLTLYGASNVYNLEIRVVSSVEAIKDEHAIITISPMGQKRPEKRITLSLWHETHYNYCVPLFAAEDPSSSKSPIVSSESISNLSENRLVSRL